MKLNKISKQYNSNYYSTNYANSIQVKLGIAKIYYLWLAYFCIIRPAKLNNNSKVLDVGCGIGNLVWALRKLRISAYGLEPSLEAKQYCVAKKYCQYNNYSKIPYKNNEFDLVYTSQVLEHIPYIELKRTLLDMERISKGLMIHMIGVKDLGPMVEDDPTHLIIQDEIWWNKKFKKLKYKVIKGNLFYFFPFIFHPKINSLKVKKGYFLINK